MHKTKKRKIQIVLKIQGNLCTNAYLNQITSVKIIGKDNRNYYLFIIRHIHFIIKGFNSNVRKIYELSRRNYLQKLT